MSSARVRLGKAVMRGRLTARVEVLFPPRRQQWLEVLQQSYVPASAEQASCRGCRRVHRVRHGPRKLGEFDPRTHKRLPLLDSASCRVDRDLLHQCVVQALRDHRGTAQPPRQLLQQDVEELPSTNAPQRQKLGRGLGVRCLVFVDAGIVLKQAEFLSQRQRASHQHPRHAVGALRRLNDILEPAAGRRISLQKLCPFLGGVVGANHQLTVPAVGGGGEVECTGVPF